jgi:hypothetical protein
MVSLTFLITLDPPHERIVMAEIVRRIAAEQKAGIVVCDLAFVAIWSKFP